MGESVSDLAPWVIHHFGPIMCSQREMPGTLAACGSSSLCESFLIPVGGSQPGISAEQPGGSLTTGKILKLLLMLASIRR